jgi:hypothetical protein
MSANCSIAKNCGHLAAGAGTERERATALLERVGCALDKTQWAKVRENAACTRLRNLCARGIIDRDALTAVAFSAREGARTHVVEIALARMSSHPQEIQSTLVPPAFLPELQRLSGNNITSALTIEEWHSFFCESMRSIRSCQASALGLKLLEILRTKFCVDMNDKLVRLLPPSALPYAYDC